MSHNRRGAILITSLWILIILSILAMGVGFRVSIEARLSKYNLDRIRGTYLAKAGIVKAMEILSKDNNAYDSIRECGITLPPDKKLEDVYFEKLGEGSFAVSYSEEGKEYYGLMDEERKININVASQAVLQNLFSSEEIAASIINWRSPKNSARALKGASDDDYKSQSPSYECKHAHFSCIEELMLLLVNDKRLTPQQFESVKDYVTVYGNADGKININTTATRVMMSYGLTDQAIGTIILTRDGADKTAETKDDRPFSGIGQAQALCAERNDVAILGNFFTTASNYFKIDVIGAADKSKIVSRIACIVKRGDKRLKYYREY